MTFRHKLSRRLAINGIWAVAGLVVAFACTQTGTAPSSDIARLVISPKQITIQPNAQTQFAAVEEMGSNGTVSPNVEWTATGGTITSDGLFTADSTPGSYSVMASMTTSTSGVLADTSQVTVASSTSAQLIIQPTDPTISLGDSLDFAAYLATSTDTTLVNATWSTTGGSIKSVGNGRGRYKSNGGGKFKIQATVDSVSDTTTTTVTVDSVVVDSVEVTPSTAALDVGQTTPLTATITDSTGGTISGLTVAWSTSNAQIATVTDSGVVTAMSAGTATITAATGSHTGTADVTVSSSGGGTASTPWWEMDFSQYANTDSLINDRGGNKGPDPTPAWFSTEDDNVTGNVFLDTDHPSGATWTKSMRYDYTGEPACPSVTIGRDIRSLPTQTEKELWVEVYVKFSANFTVKGVADGCSTPADFKWLFGLTDAGSRWEVKWGWQGNKDIILNWPQNGTDQPAYANETPYRDAGNGSQYWDGKWHQVRIHWKWSSTPTSADGVAAIAVDGVVKLNLTDIDVSTDGTFNGLAFGRNRDGMNDQSDSLWWGQTRVWNTNPGWGF